MKSFPEMIPFRQRFDAQMLEDVVEETRAQLSVSGIEERIEPGKRIAVTGGSRGIANIPEITRTIVDFVRESGGEPFIIPAMGSHGGATAEGQKGVLASYGISAKAMGCAVEATMEVVEIGRLDDDTPVLVNRLAQESGGLIIVNRIKPHTSFRGVHESGLMKMMTIGLGCHKGATMAHTQGAQGLSRLIPELGKAIIAQLPVLGGIAIVENAYDQTAKVAALRAEEFSTREPKLLAEARLSMPRLFVQGVDLLIVDEMGKEISGTGMDTNVIGRMMLPGLKEPDEPGVSRIFVRRLSDCTHGNANGVGLADVISRQLLDAIDFKATYANAFTSTFLNRAYVPIVKDNDRDAITAMFEVLRIDDGAQARVARIRNTLKLENIQISATLEQEFASHPDLAQTGEAVAMAFTGDGELI
ncbi:MAG: lactate racemase domain-containing protein [Candidatus Latescibacterota bacterium]|nr:lactate racemase domain-containing protein [Candidatus Latescibacterota bacterium]